jgi:hypothetical protein
MKKQGLPILLILMMLITPIASAFDRCSGMDMMGHFSETQKDMLNSDTSNTVDIDCQASNSCTFHGCGGYIITPSVSTVDTVISLNYSHFEYFSPYDTDLSPDLKPPIIAL